ncbi:MAG: vWA domain-containing protein [Pseudomonadota bacterium]
MLARRKSEGFNLAFLDIMSCGLGAVVLVFMLVKKNVEDSSVEIDILQDNIQELQQTRQETLSKLSQTQQQLQQALDQESKRQATLDAIQSSLQEQQTNVNESAGKIEALKSSIKGIKVEKKADLVETPVVNEENYLLGLKVEGSRIAILVDASASMTNEKLIDILKTKNGSDSDKLNAAKWIRTRQIVKWLVARLPATSDVMVIAFNEKAIPIGKSGWSNAQQENTIPAILGAMNQIVPEGATNLQVALQEVGKLSPSDIYIITDGLPTKGESRYKSLNPFASCGSLTGTSKTISGVCRVKLFQQSIKDGFRPGPKVNTILLPIEGDPDAVNQYWYWTAATGGLLISPANNWP